MDDLIYKAIQVRSPKDNPKHGGLYKTNFGRLIFRDGKWLGITNEQKLQLSTEMELCWYKKMTKKEYLSALENER